MEVAPEKDVEVEFTGSTPAHTRQSSRHMWTAPTVLAVESRGGRLEVR